MGFVKYYQIILDQVGREPTKFRSTYELIIVIADTIQGLFVLDHVYLVCLYSTL